VRIDLSGDLSRQSGLAYHIGLTITDGLMVGRALSKRVKAQIQRRETNAHADREQRKAARGDRKAEKERLESEWKVMLEHYAHRVVQWEDSCKKLREQHVMVKDLPKKPKRPLKPRPKEVDVVHVTGFENPPGIRVWVSRVWVRVEFESPVLNPYPSPGFGGFFQSLNYFKLPHLYH
jgi:hypothetical protein